MAERGSVNVWRSAAGSKKALCIAILGKIGTGKSSLINTLFGEQLSVEGQTLYAVTETTESITLMINAVRVTLWDTPGLKDPFSDGEETIRSMREACSIRDIDLFVYCTRFDQTRLSWDDIDCIRDITRGFGDEMWERALIALTFANEVGVPASCETSLQEYFQARESKWKGALHQVIKESVNLPAIKVNSIPIVATGYRDVPLPDGRNWFVDFWTACLSQANYITLPALVSVVHDRVQGTEGQTTVANAIAQQLAKLGHCIDLESEAEMPQWLDTATFPARFARGITYTWDYLKSSVFSVTGVADYGATTLASITPMQNPAIIRETAVASGSQAVDVANAPNIPSAPTPEQDRRALIATSVDTMTSNCQGFSQAANVADTLSASEQDRGALITTGVDTMTSKGQGDSQAVDVANAPNIPSAPTPEQDRRALITTSVDTMTSNCQGFSQAANVADTLSASEQDRGALITTGVDTMTSKGQGDSQGALQPFIRPITVTGKELGRGAYGQVEIVIDQLTNTRYAAKKFLSVVHIKKFTKELRILSKLEHKNIVQLKGIALPAGEDLPLLLMELLECDLHSRLEASKRGSPLSVYHKLCILHGVSEGLHYLHSQTPEKIIHRDLTAKNVLLDSQLIAKISDFGNSRFISVDEQARMTTNPGTLCYTAPEAICTTVYNERIDIFSFGHLSIFTFIEQFPHDLLPAKVPVGSGRLQALTEVDRRKEYLIKLREQVRHNLGEESMHEFVIMCLDDQPEKRPTTIELISFLELSLQKIKKQPLNDDTIFNLPSTVASQTPSTEDSSSEHIL